MDDDILRDLWEQTLEGEDLESLDPDLTHDPRIDINDVDDSVSFNAISLPSFTLAGGTLGRDTPERDSEESGIATTMGGLDPEESDPGAVTIREPGPDEASGGGESSSYIRPHESTAETAPTIVGEPGADSAGGTIDLPPPAVPSGTDPSAPQYELREIIGRGGMGIVYRARQCSLGRDVAVKRLLTARDARGHQKFLAEALVTARLDHPNVVPVHDLGQTPHGDALIAMKLVDGVPWKRVLHPLSAADQARHEELDLEDHLRILISVCNAVAFAHSRDVAHLDLKPENVMLGEFGEVLVMDWGLAVDVSDEPPGGGVPHASGVKAPCGTPAYMAPELARGNGAKVGRRTDVYLLGSILHELITGKPPHRAKGTYRVILKAARSEPPEYATDVPEELAAIAHRAMQREPDDRYPTVEALREALEDFLQHRESLTITDKARERLSACRTSDAAGAAGSDRDALYAGFAAAAAGFAQALLLWAENPDALSGEREARLAYAEAALKRGDLGLAGAQLADLQGSDASALVGRVDAASAERERTLVNEARFRHGLKIAVAVIVVGLAVGFGLVERQRQRAVASEADARQAASDAELARGEAEGARIKADQARVKAELQLADSLVESGSNQGASGDWAAARRSYRAAATILDRLGEPTFAPRLGSLIADGASPQPLLSLGSGVPLEQVAFCPDDRRVVTGDRDGRLRQWDALTGRLLKEVRAHEGAVKGLVIGPSGKIASLGAEGVVHLWTTDLTPAATPRLTPKTITAIAIDYRGKTLLTGDGQGQVQVWDATSAALIRTFNGGPSFPGHAQPVSAVATGSDARYAWSWAPDALLRWYAPGGSGYWGFRRKFPPGVLRIAPNIHRREVAFGCSDQTVRVWPFVARRPHNFTETARLTLHTGPVRGLAYSADGRHLLSGAADGRLIVWKREDEGKRFTHVRTVLDPGGGIRALAVSRRGTRVAIGSNDGALRLWDLGLDQANPTGAERARAVLRFRLPPPPAPKGSLRAGPPWVWSRAASISPDGFLAAVGTQRGSVLLFEASAGLPLRDLSLQDGPVTALAFPADDRLFTGSANGTARLWDLHGLTELKKVKVEPLPKRSVEFALHPLRGRPRVAVARGDTTLRVLDLTQGTVALSVEGESTVDVVAWSGDGQRILTASRDGSFALRAAGGRSLSSMAPGGYPAITAAALTANGERAVLGSTDGTLRLVETRSGKLVAELPRHVDRVTAIELSPDELRVFSAGVDGTWQVWSTVKRKSLRSIAGRVGKIQAFALRRDARQALVVGDALELWRFDRPTEAWKQRLRSALTTLARSPQDPAARALLGRWYAFRGELRSALALLDRPGPDSSADLARLLAHWELGHPHAAQRALADVARDPKAPAHYTRLIQDELQRLVDERGTLLSREGDRVHAVAFTPDGKRAVTTCDTGRVRVWDPREARLLRVLRHHTFGILELTISPDGKRAATGDRQGTIVVWDLTTFKVICTLNRAHVDSVKAMAFLSDGSLLTAGSKPALKRWKLADGSLLRTYYGFDRKVTSMAVSRNGKVAAVGHGRGLVRLVDIQTGEEIRSWQADSYSVSHLGFAPDGRSLFTAGWRDKGLHEWEIASSKKLRVLIKDKAVGNFTIGPAGRFCVTIERGGVVKVWDLANNGQEHRTWQVNEMPFTVALSPQGQLMTSGRWGRVYLRELNETKDR